MVNVECDIYHIKWSIFTTFNGGLACQLLSFLLGLSLGLTLRGSPLPKLSTALPPPPPFSPYVGPHSLSKGGAPNKHTTEPIPLDLGRGWD